MQPDVYPECETLLEDVVESFEAGMKFSFLRWRPTCAELIGLNG